jgi:hypothetical protein
MIDIVNEAANQYYILEIGLLMLLESSNVVGSSDSVRRNILGTKFVLKTKDKLVDIPELSGHTVLTHSEAKIEMSNPEWSGEEI